MHHNWRTHKYIAFKLGGNVVSKKYYTQGSTFADAVAGI